MVLLVSIFHVTVTHWNEYSDEDIVHTFSYMIDLGYVTLETKLIIAKQTIVDCWILNNSEICLTCEAGLEKIDIRLFGL
jgi:hypothetical protein